MRLRICGKLLDGGKGRQGPETLTLIGCGYMTIRKKGSERNAEGNAKKIWTIRNV
jgi:hypothetical protein